MQDHDRDLLGRLGAWLESPTLNRGKIPILAFATLFSVVAAYPPFGSDAPLTLALQLAVASAAYLFARKGRPPEWVLRPEMLRVGLYALLLSAGIAIFVNLPVTTLSDVVQRRFADIATAVVVLGATLAFLGFGACRSLLRVLGHTGEPGRP